MEYRLKPSDEHKRPWNRMAFTIRDLFWITIVVAILTAWMIEHKELVRLRLEEHIKTLRWKSR